MLLLKTKIIYMLKWLDILKYANNGTPQPKNKVVKSESEWKQMLTSEQFHVTRLKGTERPFSSEMCHLFTGGRYACICCGSLLFDATEKFESGTGWPSFTQPIEENAVSYVKDKSYGMVRIEALCNTCDAHLGHVFQDGPPPSCLRFCINAVSMVKVDPNLNKVTFGGGCFWCTEAVFQHLEGVVEVVSGYSGGRTKNPTYKEVTSGMTGHAEVVEITYDSHKISLYDLIIIHLTTHNPCTLNRQGADTGTQYRSIVFYRNEAEKQTITMAVQEVQASMMEKIVTEVQLFEMFYPAEAYHQNYFNQHAEQSYCQFVIAPKLEKFKQLFKDKIVKNQEL
jgi:peptide methionine sulfoxide reductase msrA/msrB